MERNVEKEGTWHVITQLGPPESHQQCRCNKCDTCDTKSNNGAQGRLGYSPGSCCPGVQHSHGVVEALLLSSTRSDGPPQEGDCEVGALVKVAVQGGSQALHGALIGQAGLGQEYTRSKDACKEGGRCQIDMRKTETGTSLKVNVRFVRLPK